ncbi:MAG: shikimate kinase [Actinomycetota bacterium]
MPGSGKTTVGRALAQLLSWGFSDTDDLLAEAVGCDFAEFIRRNGIAAARAEEKRVVATLPARLHRQVLSLGGGTLMDPENRARISALGTVVWLRAEPATLRARLAAAERDRPLLDGDLDAALANLLTERTAIYAESADAVVDVDGLDENEIAVAIVKALSA